MTTDAKPKDQFVTIDGLRFHYLDWGNPGLQPLLLLHGFTQNCHYWDLLAHNLLGEYHILALDQRGHGDTDNAPSYTHDDFVSDLEAFVDILGLEQIIIIGHSMAGRYGIAYAGRRPEKMAKLVAVDTGPQLTQGAEERMAQSSRLRVTRGPRLFTTLAEAERYLRRTSPHCSEKIINTQLQHSFRQRADGKLEFKCDAALLIHGLKRPSAEEYWQMVRQVRCPTLLIRGSLSSAISAGVAREMRKAMPNSCLVEIENAGHNVASDNPAAFEKTVRWFLKL